MEIKYGTSMMVMLVLSFEQVRQLWYKYDGATMANHLKPKQVYGPQARQRSPWMAAGSLSGDIAASAWLAAQPFLCPRPHGVTVICMSE